jgi:hypothetical protein
VEALGAEFDPRGDSVLTLGRGAAWPRTSTMADELTPCGPSRMPWCGATRPASTRQSRAVNGRGRSAGRRVPLPDGGRTALGAFAFGLQQGSKMSAAHP